MTLQSAESSMAFQRCVDQPSVMTVTHTTFAGSIQDLSSIEKFRDNLSNSSGKMALPMANGTVSGGDVSFLISDSF